mgnify:CR=1 FL=1
MQPPKRAANQWVLIAVLVAGIIGGGTGMFLLIRFRPAPAPPQPQFTAEHATELHALLDASRYDQLISRAGQVAGTVAPHPTPHRYRALGLLLSNQPAEAAKAADLALKLGAAGPEGAIVNAVNALALLQDPNPSPGLAKDPAQHALIQAGKDPQAGLLASVAFAAAVRSELDLNDGKSGLKEHVSRVRQSLEPIYASNPAEPAQAWLARFWRHGLAILAETGAFAAEAGDAMAETQALTILRRCCPAEVWACRFKIPARALGAARQGPLVSRKLDSHARAAMYTVTAVLYESAGDTLHADAVYGRAMRTWQQAMDATRDWQGQPTEARTAGRVRTVGAEYFAYRHCLDRIAVHRANQWSARIVAGRAKLDKALAASDYPLYRALVRLRGDRGIDPARILGLEGISERYAELLADILENDPSPAQAEWEQGRAKAIRLAIRELREKPAPRARPPAGPSSQPAVLSAVGPLPASPPAAGAPAPSPAYEGLADIAAGVAGGRSAGVPTVPEPADPPVAVAPEPLPDFDWTPRPSRPQARRRGTAQQAPVTQPAQQPVPEPGTAEARMNALCWQMLSQLDAGQADKAIDTYEQMQALAGPHPDMSDSTRQLMQTFEQALGGLRDLQDLISELEGNRPKQPIRRDNRLNAPR